MIPAHEGQGLRNVGHQQMDLLLREAKKQNKKQVTIQPYQPFRYLHCHSLNNLRI